jgi:hypothetical protein
VAYKALLASLRASEKELYTRKKQHEAAKGRHAKASREFEESFIGVEALRLSNEVAADRREKHKQKHAGLAREYKEAREQLEASLAGYNTGVKRLEEQRSTSLALLEQQELDRLGLEADVVMKFLVFETSMIKNSEYDIDNIGKQLETVRPQAELEALAQEYSKKEKPRDQPEDQPPATFLS